jgi:hypothetical protein
MNTCIIPRIINRSTKNIDLNCLRFTLQGISFIHKEMEKVVSQKNIIIQDVIGSNKNIEGLTELYNNKIFIRSDMINNILVCTLLLLHELYHSVGLDHCINQKCIMSIHVYNKKRKYYWKELANSQFKRMSYKTLLCVQCQNLIKQLV